MPKTGMALPPEVLEAVGDVKGAADAVKRELDKVERELTRDIVRGRDIDKSKADRADALRGKYESLKAKTDVMAEARKETKKTAAEFLKDAFNSHNPHGVVRRIMRLKVMPSDFGTLGEFVRDIGLARTKAFASMRPHAVQEAILRGDKAVNALPGMRLANIGQKLADAASDPQISSRLFLANAVILGTARRIDKYWEDMKRAGEAQKAEATRAANFARENRYGTKFSAGELRNLSLNSKRAGEMRRDLVLRGGVLERVGHFFGLDTPEANIAAAERERINRERVLMERVLGKIGGDRAAVRRAAERELMLRAAGEGSSLGKFFNLAKTSLSNIVTLGGTRRAMMDEIVEEMEVKLLQAKQQKLSDGLKERAMNPLYKNIDLERSLQLRTVAEWKMERALQWNPI